MAEIVSEIDIAAKPGEVWAVITDFAGYGAWNPFIPRVDGQPMLGSTITVHVGVAGLALPIEAEIVTVRDDEELVWRSRLIRRGLFDRDHAIRIQAVAAGCRVRQVQSFAGAIAPTAAALAEGVVRHGLDRMNAALKRRVQAPAAP